MNPINSALSIWHLESNAGADAIGGNTLTLSSSLGTTFPAGKSGNQWANESTAYRTFSRAIGSVGQIATPEATGFSFSIWSRTTNSFTTVHTAVAALGNCNSGDDWGWMIVKENLFTGIGSNPQRCRLYTRASDGTIDVIGINATLNDNAWHHLLAVRSAGENAEFRLFVDGVKVAGTSTGCTTPVSAPFAIGAVVLLHPDLITASTPGGQTTAIRGGQDEAVYWPRALSDAEAAAVYASGTGLFAQDIADPGSGTFVRNGLSAAFSSNLLTAAFSSTRMTGGFTRN